MGVYLRRKHPTENTVWQKRNTVWRFARKKKRQAHLPTNVTATAIEDTTTSGQLDLYDDLADLVTPQPVEEDISAATSTKGQLEDQEPSQPAGALPQPATVSEQRSVSLIGESLPEADRDVWLSLPNYVCDASDDAEGDLRQGLVQKPGPAAGRLRTEGSAAGRRVIVHRVLIDQKKSRG